MDNTTTMDHAEFTARRSLPMMALRGLTVFPGMMLTFEVERSMSIAALNMAMSGIRDLSTIEQPPIERQPVETFVLEYNDVILAEAMKKELARGGQVYYLHNRVDNIEACAAHVSQMVPVLSVWRRNVLLIPAKRR